MPLQNRVDPFGSLIRTTARGAMMGNRGGCIHTADREIVRPFKSRRWITCVLEFKGRHRQIMAPNQYTELFFLDEAVSLAAGHRPCAECRRPRFNAFRAAWGTPPPSADEMDLALHPVRIDARHAKVTWRAPLASLPRGSFVEIDGQPWLVLDDTLLLFTPEGYTTRQPHLPHPAVTVLTPKLTVECLRAGYQPEIHHSASSDV
jgi:hypothetical protein